MSETIHIVYCLDDGYAEPTCVSMASMLANTKSEIHFHIISNRLSDENKAKLSSLSVHFSHGQWNFHKVDFDTAGFILESTVHFTVETYYRFFIPKVLPELERIIYIDGDTVITGDILELWNENLDEKIAGVVHDIKLGDFKERSRIFGFNDWHYFNAGIILLKLKEFSKLYSLETLPQIINNLFTKFKNNKIYWFADQEVLNYLMNGKKYAKFLNIKYNLEEPDFDNYSGYISFGQNCSNLKEWSEVNKAPVIIHFAGCKKPWHLNNEIKRSVHWRLYYKYKALTPFYDLLDEKRIAEYERREKITKTEALLETKTYIQLFWRNIFSDSAEYVKRIIGNRKLAFWGAGQYIIHITTMFAYRGLYPDVVVDGLASNHGKKVFEYTVQPAEILQGKDGEYFVVICMETKQVRDIVIKLLKEYRYNENGFVHAYAEAYERESILYVSQ
jgi:lipopolysaccharide biosynthesis glycosyltransferase